MDKAEDETEVPTIEATPEQFSAFSKADLVEPLMMLNLPIFKDEAEYGSGDDDDVPCSGREAYERYLTAASEFLDAIGAETVLKTEVRCTVIAPEGEDWDLMLVVRYPSRAAMLEMLRHPEHRAYSCHRHAALADSRLIEMDPTSY